MITEPTCENSALIADDRNGNEKTLLGFHETSSVLMGMVEVLENDIRYLYGNPATARFTGFSCDAMQNRLLSEMGLSEEQIKKWLERYRLAGKSDGSVRFEYERPSLQNGESKMLWMAATLSFVGHGKTGHPRFSYLIEDISAQRKAESLAADYVRLLALSSEVGKALTDGHVLQSSLQLCTESLVRHLDAAFARIWVLNPAENVLELWASAGMYTHLDGAHSRVPVGKFKIGLIAEERKPHLTNSVVGDERVSDQEWAKREGMVSFAGYPLNLGDNLVGVMALFSRKPLEETTLEALATVSNQIAVGIERQKADVQLKDQAETLKTIHEIGQILSAELDLKRLVQAATDAATTVTGAQFGAFFYNVPAEQGKFSTLYTFSGVAPEHFAQFPMPCKTDVFAPVFKGDGTIRSGDVTQDPRYGTNSPHSGVLIGHLPVVSFLAVPVVSRSGEVIGGIFLGHEKHNVFTSQHQQVVEGIAAQAAIAIDNARLFQKAQDEVIERERAQNALLESGKQLRLVINAIPMLISYVDTEHRYRFNNRSYAEWMGKPPEEINGSHVSEVIGKADYKEIQAHIEAALSGQEVVYEREMLYQGVASRFVHTTLVPDFDEDGSVRGLVAVVNDITERRRQQDALSESERRYRFMSEAIPQIVWTSTSDGNQDYYNQRWTEYTGLSLRETLLEGGRKFLYPEDLQPTLDAWSTAVKTGNDYKIEHRLMGKDGIHRWFLSCATAMHGSDGKIIKWFGTATDIDEQKKAQERERFLGELGEWLRASNEPQEILWIAVSRTGEYLRTSRCYYTDTNLEEDRVVIHRDYCHGVESWAGTYSLSDFGSEVIRELNEGKTVAISDTLTDSRTASQYESTYLPVKIRAYLSVPLMQEGERVASLVVSQAEVTRHWTQEERVLLETIAERTRFAVENARLWQAEREQKEKLARAIQEVHHRIKNNLQGVSALLEMQIPFGSTMMPVQTVREGLNQIKTIALVHDLLAHDQPIGNVDAGKVLTKLIELLSMNMQSAKRSSSLSVNVEEVWLPTKAATSVALIVQELVTNAEKHRRTVQRDDPSQVQEIEVTLKKVEGNISVMVQDRGPGFPPDFDPAISANIGLELVTTLVRHDLQGAITFKNRTDEKGGCVEVVFSENLVSE